MKLVIDIPDDMIKSLEQGNFDAKYNIYDLVGCLMNGTPLSKGHGRLGDIDELEQRISNYVEHDANITDEYTVIRQRFIVDGIRQT